MYDSLPSFVLAFHGCDSAVAEAVFAGRDTLKPSENKYDWLGHGIYFWENSPERALDYARLLAGGRRPSARRVSTPAVIGAVIDLGECLNLLDAKSIAFVKQCHQKFEVTALNAQRQMPTNRVPTGSNELLLRNLDCAVIEFVHLLRRKESHAPFDSVRAAFVEGEPLYANAGFHERTHIQICVRDSRRIKGYFRVLGTEMGREAR